MSSETTKDKLTPQTYAEKKLLELLESSEVRPEFAQELLKQVEEKRNSATAFMSSIETQPEKRLSFSEAANFLKGTLDLEMHRAEAVKSHIRWGLVDTFIKQGIIKNADQYGALFDNVTVNESSLNKLREILEFRTEKTHYEEPFCDERGFTFNWRKTPEDNVIYSNFAQNGVLPIFDPGHITPATMFEGIFWNGHLPKISYNDTYVDSNILTNQRTYEILSKLRKINPNTIQDLKNLHAKSPKRQLEALINAYNAAGPFQPTEPHLIFTPNILSVDGRISAIVNMQTSAKGGINFIDANADFIRHKTQMDSIIKRTIENNHKITNFDNLTKEEYQQLLIYSLNDRDFSYKMHSRYDGIYHLDMLNEEKQQELWSLLLNDSLNDRLNKKPDRTRAQDYNTLYSFYPPDFKDKHTCYPNYIFENGQIPCLFYRTGRVNICDYAASYSSGSRIYLD